MNHENLSSQLAIAIGYAPECIKTDQYDYITGEGSIVTVWHHKGKHYYENGLKPFYQWRTFDYRDPSVCLPVLEWLLREYVTALVMVQGSYRLWSHLIGVLDVNAPTLPEAVARAAIAVKEKK